MDFLHKFLLSVILLVTVCWVCCIFLYKAEKAQNEALRQENALLDQILKEEQIKAQKAISEANERISKYEINKTKYEAVVMDKIENIDNETKSEEVRIITEIQKDASAENQLKLIEGILHDFSSKR